MSDREDIERQLRLKASSTKKKDETKLEQKQDNGAIQININNGSMGNLTISSDKLDIDDMSKDDKEAFEKGEWDGIERRDEENISAFNKGFKEWHRRSEDDEEEKHYYIVLGIPFFILFFWGMWIAIDALGATNA